MYEEVVRENSLIAIRRFSEVATDLGYDYIHIRTYIRSV